MSGFDFDVLITFACAFILIADMVLSLIATDFFYDEGTSFYNDETFFYEEGRLFYDDSPGYYFVYGIASQRATA